MVKKSLTVVEIKCFVDGRRKFTHLLTKNEAKALRRTAQRLEKYLTKTYGLSKPARTSKSIPQEDLQGYRDSQGVFHLWVD